MPLQDFNFPYHTFETINPETGFRGQFGGTYTFTATPDSPDQRIFKLGFAAMKFFTDGSGNVINDVVAEINMKNLIDFYHEHKLHMTFNYEHPVHGVLVVKFAKPLPEPKGVIGGTGVVESFEVELVEIP